jgi:hypothetical protein
MTTDAILNPDEEKKVTTPVVELTGDELIAKLVADGIELQLKDIKGKLDNAFKARDEAFAKAAAMEQQIKADEVKRLQAEGKHKEVLEIQLAEERAKREATEKRNTELSRDIAVRSALNGLPFRNERATELAYKEIIAGLVQREDGVWTHSSGVSIQTFVEEFAKDEEQSFLFKTKSNSGGGSRSSDLGGGAPAKPKSLFNMSQADVLKLAAEGKLPNQRK